VLSSWWLSRLLVVLRGWTVSAPGRGRLRRGAGRLSRRSLRLRLDAALVAARVRRRRLGRGRSGGGRDGGVDRAAGGEQAVGVLEQRRGGARLDEPMVVGGGRQQQQVLAVDLEVRVDVRPGRVVLHVSRRQSSTRTLTNGAPQAVPVTGLPSGFHNSASGGRILTHVFRQPGRSSSAKELGLTNGVSHGANMSNFIRLQAIEKNKQTKNTMVPETVGAHRFHNDSAAAF